MLALLRQWRELWRLLGVLQRVVHDADTLLFTVSSMVKLSIYEVVGMARSSGESTPRPSPS